METITLTTADSPDFHLDNHGSICILFADSDAAKQWVAEHIPSDAQTWGRNGTVIEPRYVATIVAGFQGDGLSI